MVVSLLPLIANKCWTSAGPKLRTLAEDNSNWHYPNATFTPTSTNAQPLPY